MTTFHLNTTLQLSGLSFRKPTPKSLEAKGKIKGILKESQQTLSAEPQGSGFAPHQRSTPHPNGPSWERCIFPRTAEPAPSARPQIPAQHRDFAARGEETGMQPMSAPHNCSTWCSRGPTHRGHHCLHFCLLHYPIFHSLTPSAILSQINPPPHFFFLYYYYFFNYS